MFLHCNSVLELLTRIYGAVIFFSSFWLKGIGHFVIIFVYREGNGMDFLLLKFSHKWSESDDFYSLNNFLLGLRRGSILLHCCQIRLDMDKVLFLKLNILLEMLVKRNEYFTVELNICIQF